MTALPPAPQRPDDGHKGTFGTIIVIGGSETMLGAPALCASSALRSGVGLAKIATLPAVLPFAIVIEPSATGMLLQGDRDAVRQALEDADEKKRAVLAVGTGLGQSDWAGEIVEMVLRQERAVVLDADGLNLLAKTGKPRPNGGDDGGAEHLVLTPHPGEFARLAKPLGIKESPTDADQRPAAAAKLALAHRAVVVLKGHHTVVSDGQQIYTNDTGNPAMATAGSGDVLTGCIAALMAQGMAPWDAAVLGVHLHGLAGDMWRDQNGISGLRAYDLANILPQAFETYRNAH